MNNSTFMGLICLNEKINTCVHKDKSDLESADVYVKIKLGNGKTCLALPKDVDRRPCSGQEIVQHFIFIID